VEGCDGLDILPTLAGDSAREHDALHWDCGFQWAVRSGPWKLSWVADDENVDHLKTYEHAPMGNGWFLANLSDDLSERQNLIESNAATATRLRELHTAWRENVGLPTHP
jgi:arylsulfatase A-like enzyme